MTSLLAFAVMGLGSQQSGGDLAGLGGDERKYTQILAPGDKADWKLEAKTGDVVILKVHSDVFDPEVEVVDETGKLLGQNDDVAPGNQDSQLLVVFAKDGTYHAHVIGKSNSGGTYQLSVQRFPTQPVAPGHAIEIAQPEQRMAHVLLHMKKGETAACTVSARTQISVFGPAAQWVSQPTGIPFMTSRFVLRADDDGDYIATFANPGTASFTLANAVESQVSIGAEPPSRSVPLTGIDIWKVHVPAGTFLTAEALGNDACTLNLIMDARTAESLRMEAPEQTLFERKHLNRKRIFAWKDIDIQMSVQAIGKGTTNYKFVVQPAWRQWAIARPDGASLPVSGEHYWAFDASAGDVLTLGAETKAFDPALRLLDHTGETVAFTDNVYAVDPKPSMVVPIRTAGRYYLKVFSEGGGGGGQYSVSSKLLKAEVLPVGLRKAIDPSLSSGQVFESTFKKGALVAIALRGDSPVANVYGVDGKEIPLQWARLDGDTIGLLKPPADGKYRLWVRSGVTSFRVDPLPQ